MNNQAFSKIWIVSILLALVAGGILTWQYFGIPKEKVIQTETTKWKEYTLEEITQDFQSPNFMDRRLVGIRDDGQRDVIIPNVKELMSWEKTPGETGFYPVKVSFPPHSNKIFFTKHMAGTGHSTGFFMLDVNTLEFRQLTEVGPIYENYYNYLSIISPDGFKIASLGGEKLYLLDLLNDKVELLVETKTGEVFNPSKELPDFVWLDSYTIQYPVYSAEKIYNPPIEVRQISIETKKAGKVVEDENAGWKTYRNEEYRFEVKYPDQFSVTETYFSEKPPSGIHLVTKDKNDFKGIIWIRMFAKNEQKSREECIGEEQALLSYVEQKIVNSIIFYHFVNYPEHIGAYCGMSMGCHYKDIYGTFYNDNCYQIEYVRSDREFIEGNPYDPESKTIGDVKEVPTLFYKILSTFRFLE